MNIAPLLILFLLSKMGKQNGSPSPSSNGKPNGKGAGSGDPSWPATTAFHPVAKVNTGGGAQWKADRLAALERAGVTGEVALAALAHMGLETGRGKGEWNYNVANRMASKGENAIYLGVGPQWFKAYDSLDDGVREYLALMQGPRYGPCLAAASASAAADIDSDPTTLVKTWAACLAKQGYAGKEFTSDEQAAKYGEAVANVRKSL